MGSNNLRNNSGVLDPTYECYLDGVKISNSPYSGTLQNYWQFCGEGGLVDGPHVLTLNATVSRQQTFWFDAIRYTPSPTIPLASKAILVDATDASIKFGDGWGVLRGIVNMTTTTGSSLDFDFYGEMRFNFQVRSESATHLSVLLLGVSLAWYGFIPKEFPGAAATGSYSIDGQNPVTFPLQGLPSGSADKYNQKFFETPRLPVGQHNITVVFRGNEKTTPLTLDFLVAQNGTGSMPTSTSSSPTTMPSVSGSGSSSMNPGPTGNASKNNTGAIAGGVLGGIVLGILLVRLFLWYKMRRQPKQQKGVSNSVTPTMDGSDAVKK